MINLIKDLDDPAWSEAVKNGQYLCKKKAMLYAYQEAKKSKRHLEDNLMKVKVLIVNTRKQMTSQHNLEKLNKQSKKENCFENKAVSFPQVLTETSLLKLFTRILYDK